MADQEMNIWFNLTWTTGSSATRVMSYRCEILENGNAIARVRMDDTAFSAEIAIELKLRS